ncbi:hypothetical protein BH24ACT22_BH24ACT22_16240 [soil metagenome]
MDSTENQPDQATNEARPRRRRRGWIIGGIVAVGLLLLTAASLALVLLVGLGSDGGRSATAPAAFEEEYIQGEGSDKIAVIPVEGTIASADSSVSEQLPTTTPDGLRDALRQAEEDESVIAVVLEINSPGGGATASDKMYRQILDFKESSKKPVVAYFGGVAASGGYYIATAADEIVSERTALTGSLGVVLPLINFSEAADDLGVKQNAITSGEFKTMGSQFKELSDKERKIFQSYVDDGYDQLVEVIMEGRDLPEKRVREIADGRIYSASRAKKLDLIDALGDLEKAIKTSRNNADAKETQAVRYVQPESFSDLLLGRFSSSKSTPEVLLEETGLNLERKLYYLYMPGL